MKAEDVETTELLKNGTKKAERDGKSTQLLLQQAAIHQHAHTQNHISLFELSLCCDRADAHDGDGATRYRETKNW